MNAAASGRFIETAGRKTPPPSADYHFPRAIRIVVATQAAARQALASLPRLLSRRASGVSGCPSANAAFWRCASRSMRSIGGSVADGDGDERAASGATEGDGGKSLLLDRASSTSSSPPHSLFLFATPTRTSPTPKPACSAVSSFFFCKAKRKVKSETKSGRTSRACRVGFLIIGVIRPALSVGPRTLRTVKMMY